MDYLYLNDEQDDGVFRIIVGRVLAFQDTALRSRAKGAGRTRGARGAGVGRHDCYCLWYVWRVVRVELPGLEDAALSLGGCSHARWAMGRRRLSSSICMLMNRCPKVRLRELSEADTHARQGLERACSYGHARTCSDAPSGGRRRVGLGVVRYPASIFSQYRMTATCEYVRERG